MALVITVAGVNRTSVTDFDNITVTQIADSYTFSAEVTINDRDSDITIKAGSHLDADKVTLVDGGETFFGGFVDDIDFECLEDGSRRQHLHCVGYGVLLGECAVEYEEYDALEGGTTDKAIIEEIFANADYLNDVIATGATVIVLADPLVILFEEMTVDEIMTAICNRTGGRFYVDNDLVLHYFSAEANDCGFDLSDTPNDVTSFGYFDNPEKTRTGGNLVNRARIVGADGYTATRNDVPSQGTYGIQAAIVTDATLFATSELNERGDDVLDDQKDPRDQYVVSTTHAGAVAGDLIDFKCADLGYNSISDGDPQLVIREIHVRWEQGDPVYQMTLGELEYSSIAKSKSVATQVKALVVAQGKAGGQGWGHNLEFSATDHNTVEWQSGVIVSDKGKTYNIDAGNTANMAAVTYVYLRISPPPAAAPTALSAGTDIGDIFALKKSVVLIAVCCNVTAGLAEFNVFRGGHATPGGTAVHNHSDADAGDVNVRPDRIGVDAAVADLDGVIALAETFEASDPTNVAGVGMLYCKDNEGTYLYFMNDAGDITTLGIGADDHGDLLGLGDDDHAQYLLASGGRAVTGAMTTRNLIPDVDARTLGDAAHTYDLYTEVVAHYGATGNNFIVLPDNLADGLHFADLGTLADHYLTFVSANAQREVVVNENGADIDFRVEGVAIPNLFTVFAGGAVGIKCALPTQPLEVGGPIMVNPPAGNGVMFINSTAESGFILMKNGAVDWQFTSTSGTDFAIYNYGVGAWAFFMYDTVARVGIYDTTPSVALDVNGVVRADDYLEYSSMFLGDALAAIRHIRHVGTPVDGWANVDHEFLPPGIRRVMEKERWWDKKTDKKMPRTFNPRVDVDEADRFEKRTEIEQGRSVGAGVQLNLRAIRQLVDRIEILERRK